jgi:hypothetical protein
MNPQVAGQNPTNAQWTTVQIAAQVTAMKSINSSTTSFTTSTPNPQWYRDRSVIVKKISMLIALVSVIGAIAQSAQAQNLVRFSGGIGDISTGSTDTTVRGVPAAGQIWVIRDLSADVKQDGRIRVDGRGLLLGSGDAVGSNGNASVFATLFCSNDGNVPHSSNPAGIPLEVDGDFRIDDTLSPAPPNQCASPVLLIRVTTGAWFAAGIPK